jgi:3-oxoacyl-[acyl-carrier-protein] synthase II
VSTERTKVVVTGVGATTPVGGDATSTWEALLAGRSGVRRIEADWSEILPVKIAAPLAVDIPDAELISRVEARRLDRSGQMAMIAAREAWADAGAPEVDGERLGVVIASGIGGVTTLLDAYDVLKNPEQGPSRISPLTVTAPAGSRSGAWRPTVPVEMLFHFGRFTVQPTAMIPG